MKWKFLSFISFSSYFLMAMESEPMELERVKRKREERPRVPRPEEPPLKRPKLVPFGERLRQRRLEQKKKRYAQGLEEFRSLLQNNAPQIIQQIRKSFYDIFGLKIAFRQKVKTFFDRMNTLFARRLNDLTTPLIRQRKLISTLPEPGQLLGILFKREIQKLLFEQYKRQYLELNISIMPARVLVFFEKNRSLLEKNTINAELINPRVYTKASINYVIDSNFKVIKPGIISEWVSIRESDKQQIRRLKREIRADEVKVINNTLYFYDRFFGLLFRIGLTQ